MIAVIPGNDFELTRLEPIIRELASRNFDYIIVINKEAGTPGRVHSFSSESMHNADHELYRTIETDDGTTTADMIGSIENVFRMHTPEVALISGDSDYALAAAIVAAKKGSRPAHIEAGLRNYNRSDQSEINRVIIDRISHYLFALDVTARENLVGEGIDESRISVFGNTDGTEWWAPDTRNRFIPAWIIVTILQGAYQNLYSGVSGTGQASPMKE